MPHIYRKRHSTHLDHVRHLLSKGLTISDPGNAARKIEQIGYARLRIYFESRRQIGVPGKPFITGTKFQDILRIYNFDAEIRKECFAAVGELEIALRNNISEALSVRFGSHPYLKSGAYRNASQMRVTIQSLSNVYVNTRDQRAKYYMENYIGPALPPIWYMKEFLTFGRCSRLLQGLNPVIRGHVANALGIPSQHILTDWIEALVDLRNICAHHDRLFNRTFQKQPIVCKQHGIPNAALPRAKLGALLQCLDHMMDAHGTPVRIEQTVRRILTRYSRQISPSEVGL